MGADDQVNVEIGRFKRGKVFFCCLGESWKCNGRLFSVASGRRRVLAIMLAKFGGQTRGPRSKKAEELICWLCKLVTGCGL